MKKNLILVFALLLVFTARCSASAPAADTEKSSPTFHQISQDEAKEMMAKDDGHVVVDVRRQDEYDAGHIIKPRYSAFFATGLDLILRRLGIRHLLLAGTTTPNCIRTTCYDAISLDYAVTVLSDCTSSKTPEIQESNLRDMANVGAVIVSSKEIIKEAERA